MKTPVERNLTAPVRNARGENIGEMTLPEELFDVARNSALVLQAVRILRGNRRVAVAHTKHRGEVSGGGRKPWRQKGTGNARHGSTRSPIWIGGGVAFGPRNERVFSRILPRKMRRRALLSALSAKHRTDSLVLVDAMPADSPKTKDIARMLQALGCGEKRTLIALPELRKDIVASCGNLPGVRTMRAQDLNVLDLLADHWLVLPLESIPVIASTFLEKNASEKSVEEAK